MNDEKTRKSAPQSSEHSHTHEHVHGPGCNHGPAEKVQPLVRTAPKVGRNDACPCGSQKKFKKCCGT